MGFPVACYQLFPSMYKASRGAEALKTFSVTLKSYSFLHAEILATLKGHSGLVKGLTWDPVGKYIASQADDRSLKVWRTMDWQLETSITKPFDEVCVLGEGMWNKRRTVGKCYSQHAACNLKNGIVIRVVSCCIGQLTLKRNYLTC